jgi:hypothetical protein
MAIRLGDYVVYGELRNTRNYSTHGILVLRGETEGEETVMRLDLTGNCEPDLKGKGFRFTPDESESGNGFFRRELFPGFQDMQVGPTGTVTAHGWVRTLGCPVEEFMQRSKLGEPPPTQWKRRVYLEWFGQNGRMVVELPGATVEECIRDPNGDDDDGDWRPLPNSAASPESGNAEPAAGLGIAIVEADGDSMHVEQWSVDSNKDEDEFDDGSLQGQLDREAADVERAIRGGEASSDDDIQEMELMDYCIENSDGEPVGTLMGDVGALPEPEELSEDELECKLKVILARLALIGVALDVCEHYSIRDCYQLLKETILPKTTAYGELIGTGWVQHSCTYDYCKKCQAELDDDDSDAEEQGS